MTTRDPAQQNRIRNTASQSPAGDESGWREATARLLYVVEHRKPCAFVTGASGSGKSALLRHVRHQTAASGNGVAWVDLTGMTAEEAVWQIAAGFGLAPRMNESSAASWQRITDHLRGMSLMGAHAVAILDHLDRADIECGLVVDRLVHCETGPPRALTTIVATSVSNALSRDLSAMRIELQSPDAEGALAHVRRRFGRVADDVTLPASLKSVPNGGKIDLRRLDRLCDLVDVAMVDQERATIDSATLEAVAEQLLP